MKSAQSVLDVVSLPARRISEAWSMISRGVKGIPVSGRVPEVRMCWRRSGRAWLVGSSLRFWIVESMACGVVGWEVGYNGWGNGGIRE